MRLGALLETFPGDANQTRCFTHILNLVAKTAIHQFDVPKAKADAALTEAEAELQALADGLDIEEDYIQREVDDEDEDDDVSGWVNECTLPSLPEREELDASVRPVRLVLVKVSLHSTTDFGKLTVYSLFLQLRKVSYGILHSSPQMLS